MGERGGRRDGVTECIVGVLGDRIAVRIEVARGVVIEIGGAKCPFVLLAQNFTHYFTVPFSRARYDPGYRFNRLPIAPFSLISTLYVRDREETSFNEYLAITRLFVPA